CAHGGRVPPGPERNGLRRGPERGGRIPLGGGPKRSIACLGGRPRWPPSGRDCRDHRPRRAGGQSAGGGRRDRRPPRGYVPMISREKLERHSCKCYGEIHSYVAGVFTICGLSSHAPVNLFGLGQILRRQTNV